MIPTTWIYHLKKDELVTYLEEFELDTSGNVEELRRRLSQFVSQAGEQHEDRLRELAIRHARLASPKPNEQSATLEPKKPITTLQSYAWPAWIDAPKVITTTASGGAATNTQVTEALTATTFTQPIENYTTHIATTGASTLPVNCPEETTRNEWPHREIEITSLMEKIRKWAIKYAGGQGALAFIDRIEELSDAYGIDKNPLPRSKHGNTTLLVFFDKFTKWVELVALRQATADTLQKAFRERVISRIGIPKLFICDNGTQFTSKKFQGFLKNLVVLVMQREEEVSVLMMNSLPSARSTKIREALTVVVNTCKPHCRTNGYDVAVIRQENMVDCGVHLINNTTRFMQHLASGSFNDVVDIEGQMMRETKIKREDIRALVDAIRMGSDTPSIFHPDNPTTLLKDLELSESEEEMGTEEKL